MRDVGNSVFNEINNRSSEYTGEPSLSEDQRKDQARMNALRDQIDASQSQETIDTQNAENRRNELIEDNYNRLEREVAEG